MKRIAAFTFVAILALSALAQDAVSPAHWIGDLDHPKYKVREAAFGELMRLGDKAVPAMQDAMRGPISPEARDRIHLLLAMRRPSEFDADFNGWHWVYSWITHAQTFEATGGTVKSLKLRVAQLSANRPIAPLDVEIRDKKLETIYLRGTIDPAVLQQDFSWQHVKLHHVAPLKFGETYALVFHSRNNVNTSPWAVNAIYSDVYPKGNQWYVPTEDFFFHIEYKEGTSLRVGPKSDDAAKMKTPINSGAQGGAVENGGGLQLQGFGRVPEGKVVPR